RSSVTRNLLVMDHEKVVSKLDRIELRRLLSLGICQPHPPASEQNGAASQYQLFAHTKNVSPLVRSDVAQASACDAERRSSTRAQRYRTPPANNVSINFRSIDQTPRASLP